MKEKYSIYLVGVALMMCSCQSQETPKHDAGSATASLEKEIVLYESDPNTPQGARGLGSLADPQSMESMADAGVDRNDDLIPDPLYRRMNPTGATLAQF